MDILLICVIALALNIPMGWWRAGQRKFSFKWFLAIHLPVPFVIAVRLLSDVSWGWIPLFIILSVAGQMAGSWLAPRFSSKYGIW